MTNSVIRVAALALLALALAACQEDAKLDRPRTVDVAALTFEEVQQRALDATSRPGEVFHVTSTSGGVANPSTSEGWVDRERNLGRSESSHGLFVLAVYHDDRVAALSPSGSGRFVDAAITSGVPAGALSIHALDYLAPLFAPDYAYIRRELRAGTHDGAPMIVAEIETEVYESSDTSVTETYLDESFLPAKIERSRAGSRETISIEFEFLSRESLPADFFSIEAVRAAATTPADDVQKAKDADFDPYWLGERFEEMVLRDESHFEFSSSLAGELVLRLSYGPPGDGPVPVPCTSLTQYSASGWEQILERRADNSQSESRDVELAKLQLPGAVATIFERSNGGIPLATLVAGPTPAGQPDLPGVPDDTGRILEAIVKLDSGGAIEVSSNCGPLGSNIYRTPDAFRRLVGALHPFDAASP